MRPKKITWQVAMGRKEKRFRTKSWDTVALKGHQNEEEAVRESEKEVSLVGEPRESSSWIQVKYKKVLFFFLYLFEIQKSISRSQERPAGLSKPSWTKAKKTDIGFRNMEVTDEFDRVVWYNNRMTGWSWLAQALKNGQEELETVSTWNPRICWKES